MTTPAPKDRDESSRGLSPVMIAVAMGGAVVVYWVIEWLKGVAP